jgi:MoaA/NifB/PqqE/SkfB family radical SAM enzyme
VRLADFFERIVENVRRLRILKYVNSRTKPFLGVVFVAMKRNIGELSDVMDLVSRLGAVRFLVTNLLPYSEEMKNQTLYGRSMWNCDFRQAGLIFPAWTAFRR